MIILALDSTGADCSACLTRGSSVLAHASERIGRGHAERIAPMVADLFDASSLAPADVERVAVCTGPGSFTGQRVALSLAKGFALPHRLPVIGIDALEIEANRLMDVDDVNPVTVYRDVKRGQVFAATYRDGVAVEPPQAMTMEAAQALAERSGTPLHEAESCDVRVLARLAASADPNRYPANPLYARAPDAKLPGGVTPPA